MTKRPILLTIKEVYANRILNGEQTVEHRTRPPRISEPTRTIMYVSRAKTLVGEFAMGPRSGDRNSLGFPLPVHNPIRYARPMSWESVKREIVGIRRPQRSFRYLDPVNAEDARLLEMLEHYRMR